MSQHATEPQRTGDTPQARDHWGRALILAAAMLFVCYLCFVLVPNNLLSYLSLHVQPKVRDLLVTLWWAVAFVACCVLFVRLQGKR